MHSTSSGRNSEKLNRKLVSYASAFASFILRKTESKITSIILFGSAARNEAGAKSDIDIFIDGELEEKEAESLVNAFYKSEEHKKWELLGIKQDIKPVAGHLRDWKELEESIAGTGILLYGIYQGISSSAEPKVIFTWDEIKPNSSRVLFNKRLFGFLHYTKHYAGLLEKCNGSKLGKGSFIAPYETRKEFIGLFRKHKAKWAMRKVFESNV